MSTVEAVNWLSESLADDVVGLVRGTIEHRRHHSAAYGGFALTPDQRDELARAVASHIIAAYRLERLP